MDLVDLDKFNGFGLMLMDVNSAPLVFIRLIHTFCYLLHANPGPNRGKLCVFW